MSKRFIPLGHIFQGNDNILCGPASVKMVLSQSHPSTESLEAIAADTTIADPDWDSDFGSSPLGIETAIFNRVPSGRETPVSVQGFDGRDELTWRICWSIDNRSMTPVVLVLASKHWIVVNGYVRDTRSEYPQSSTASIRYLLISDPAIPFGGETEAPTGIIQAISRHEWDAVYLQKPYPLLRHADTSQSAYTNRFIAVLDGAGVDYSEVSSAPFVADPHDFQFCTSCPELPADHFFVNEPLFDEEPWNRFPDHVDARPPHFYTLNGVEYRTSCMQSFVERGTEDVVLIVRYRCSDSVFRSAIAAPEGTRLFDARSTHYGKTAEEALESMRANGVPVGSDDSTVIYDPVKDQASPRLFWEPCKESVSLDLPFYEIAAYPRDGDESDQKRLFVRMDGKGFLDLQRLSGGPQE